MVLVGQIQGLGQTAGSAVNVGLGGIEGLGEGEFWVEVRVVIGLALSALEVSGALGITKYVGFKEGLVSFGSVIVVGRTLRMEFQGGLEAL